MGPATWEKYLFNTHKVVAVDPWCGPKLALLDVFTKEGGYGIINRGPLLATRGAMTQLVKKRSDGNPEPSAAQAQSNLEEARKGKECHCESRELPPVHSSLKSSSKFLASLGSILCVDHTNSKNLKVQTSMVKSESIKQDFLVEQVQGGRWKPDPNSPLMPKNWDRVLWVVTEILYVKKLVIAKNTMAIERANFDASKLVACAGPLPVALRGGIEVSKAEDGTIVFQVPESGPSFPIGFKVIRLNYDEDGELLTPGGIKLDIGKNHRPKMRSDNDEWLDPNKYPDYHMKDLFEQEQEESLEPWPVFIAKEAEEASPSDPKID